MSFRVPATNNYFGLVPVSVGGYNTNFQANYYLVSSSEGEIAAYDPVVMTSIGTVASVAARYTGSFTPSSSSPLLGVAAMGVLANTGSTAALVNINSSVMCLVYDAPGQVFSINESSSGIIGTFAGAIGKAAPVLATGVVGSTGNFQSGKQNVRSVVALSGVQTSNGGGGAVKIIGLDPCEINGMSTLSTGTASTVGTRKWLVELITQIQTQASTAAGAAFTNTSS